MSESPDAATTFGELLQRLRKRAGMTQDDLAAATGYSRSLIGALERDERLPDVEVVIQAYLPALGLQDEPRLAAQLVELAALARGERPPSSLTFPRERRVVSAQEAREETHCFPVPPTEILGRDAEISRLCDRLLGHQGRLLTLVGPPGVGKTRLAQAVGARLAGFYRDGACFVPLAAVTDPELVAFTLASALQLHDGSTRPPRTRLIEHLRRKEMLLVLDNFEQLISASSSAVDLAAQLLAECPGLCILITSRERLHLRAEQRYRVQPLALEAAVELFEERAAAVDAESSLMDTERPTIEVICEEVDRLPLAIELCAAQMDFLSPLQLLAGLRARRLDVLVGGAQDLAPHQRTLRTTIAHSYALLDEEERRLFRSLGVFVGGCALEEMEAVGGQRTDGRAVREVLHRLVGKSLVRVETASEGAARYGLLETIREYALEEARAAVEEHLLRERHFAAYLRLYRAGDARLRGPEAATWLARLEIEQDNLRTALRWAFDQARYADATWLFIAVGWFWAHTGNTVESYRWSRLLLPHRMTLDARLRMALLIAPHPVVRSPEEARAIAPYTAEMMSLLEVCPEQLFHATAWYFYCYFSADPAEVGNVFERAIACARAAYDEPGLGLEFGVVGEPDFVLGNALSDYALYLIQHGEFARAAPLLAESYQIFQARGSRHEMADTLAALGRVALLQGNLAEARALFHEAVTLARAFRGKLSLAFHQKLLGLVTLYGGNAPEARRLLEDSLRVCSEINDEGLQAQVCVYLAETALWEGALGEAEGWLARSLAYDADPRRTDIDQIERVLLAARLATAQGAYPWAAALFGLAEKLCSPLRFEFAGPVRRLADDALAQVRGALGPTRFNEAFAAGQQLSLEEAFAAIAASSAVAGAPPLLRQLSA